MYIKFAIRAAMAVICIVNITAASERRNYMDRGLKSKTSKPTAPTTAKPTAAPITMKPKSSKEPTVVMPKSSKEPTVVMPKSSKEPTVVMPKSSKAPTVVMPKSSKAPTVVMPKSSKDPNVGSITQMQESSTAPTETDEEFFARI